MAADPAFAPRVSILLPNFNNGRQSSQSGRDDMIGRLLRSLHDTLHDDPTPLEIIAYDDGSTDDSLPTLREWSRRTWGGPRGEQPFLELVEAPHCGYLSRIANILSRKARGEVLVRLDGDIICLTSQWARLMCGWFDRGPAELGILGPKQLRIDHRIHAYGDFVLHPKGYTHVATGMPRDAVQHPLRVDHIMGCFYCCRRAVFDSIDGYDERFLRGQTEDFGLRALLQGWIAMAVPDFEFIHAHMARHDRATEADSSAGILKTVDLFIEKWGFDRLAADLDEVKRRYAGTPLVWNERVFGTIGAPREHAPAPTIQESRWARYANDPAHRDAVNLRQGIVLDILHAAGLPRSTVVLGSGEGLATHLLAARGLTCVGLEVNPNLVAFSRRCTQNQRYPAAPPQFAVWENDRHIPAKDGSIDLLLMFDLIERHENPAALLRQAARVLGDNRVLVIVSRRASVNGPDPSDPTAQDAVWAEHRYHWVELVNQVQATRAWDFCIDPKTDDVTRDMVLVLRRRERTAAPSPRPVNAVAM